MVKLPFNLKDIKPGEFSYITKRKLENKKGDVAGEIVVWKRPTEEEHSFAMECPECKKESVGKTMLERRPYRVQCPNCNKSIALKRLKNEK